MSKTTTKTFILSSLPQFNSVHEIHRANCKHLPHKNNRIQLGTFDNYKQAEAEAHIYFDKIDGCYYCQYEHNDGVKKKTRKNS